MPHGNRETRTVRLERFRPRCGRFRLTGTNTGPPTEEEILAAVAAWQRYGREHGHLVDNAE